MQKNHSKHLKTLELQPDASPADIKAAYRDLAKVWHPDRFPADSALQEKAQKRLQSINEAYEALKDYEPLEMTEPTTPRAGAQPRVLVTPRPTIPIDRVWVFVSGVAIAVVLLLIWSAI